VPGPHTGQRWPTARASWRHSPRAAPLEAAASRRPGPGRWPPWGWLVSAAAGPDARWAPAAVAHATSSSHAAWAPATSLSPREAAETADAASAPNRGGFGPGPRSHIRSFLRLSWASWSAAASQPDPRRTWLSLSPSERLGASTARRSRLASPAAALPVRVSGWRIRAPRSPHPEAVGSRSARWRQGCTARRASCQDPRPPSGAGGAEPAWRPAVGRPSGVRRPAVPGPGALPTHDRPTASCGPARSGSTPQSPPGDRYRLRAAASAPRCLAD
jgi:hypothetical protein